MATFTATTNPAIADAVGGTLLGFTGGTLAELQDAAGDMFSNAGGATITAGAGDDKISAALLGGASSVTSIFNGGSGNDTVMIFNEGTSGGTIDGGDGTDTLVVGNGYMTQSFFPYFEVRDFEILKVSNGYTPNDFHVNAMTSEVLLTRAQAEAFETIEFYVPRLSLIHFVISDIGFLDLSSELKTQGAYLEFRGGSVVLGAGNDYLIGQSGNDRLDGGKGIDKMYGGGGDDTYVVDQVGDKVIEVAGSGGGIDTVNARMTYTLVANAENLILTGASAINGMGTAANNSITGNRAANTLFGFAGNDKLDGGAGTDTLVGGFGNDVFSINVAGDKIIETATSGIDTVTSATISLNLNVANYANVEFLRLLGNVALRGLGNSGNNLIVGNAGANTLQGMGGNDVLDGGLGNDLLAGGAGRDTFVFESALNGATNRDTILDFVSGVDKIRLENTGIGLFNALSTRGSLNPDYFVSNAGAIAARDTDDHVIYNSTTGNLYYDVDGSGAAGAIKFATISGHPLLRASDFVVV